MTFKNRIKQLRVERGLTQDDLAKILNYGRTAISNYESGRSEPSYTDLKKIADFFNVSIDYLLFRSNIRNPYKETPETVEDDNVTQKQVYEAIKQVLIEKGVIHEGDEITEQQIKKVKWILDRALEMINLSNE